MRILLACEKTQAVTIELRKLGIEAWSNDIQECSGGHPEWHIKGDAIAEAYSGKYDAMIGFPPCTHLAVSGSTHFEVKRKDGRQQQGIDFFMKLVNAPIGRIAIENPVGIMSSIYRKPTQIIQPYYFGDAESKKTCLWLKNFPKLNPTNILKLPGCGYWNNQTPEGQNKIVVDGVWIGFNDPLTAEIRSATYPGIAKAIAKQWGHLPSLPNKSLVQLKQLYLL
jgi:hypothetical protein